jgi:hypothetical protein
MRLVHIVLVLISLGNAVFAAENSNVTTVPVGNKPALSLRLPPGWTSEYDGVQTNINAGQFGVRLQLWNVARARSVKEAFPLVAETIKGQVLKFKPRQTAELPIAGSAGKHLIGTGTEADDGDPSQAEIFLFSVGEKVFLLCAHGEGKGPASAREEILKMLATARRK